MSKSTSSFHNHINKLLLGALLLAVIVIAYLIGKDQSLTLGSRVQEEPIPTITIPTNIPPPSPTDIPIPTKIVYPTATPIPPTPTVDPSQQYITIGGYNGEVLNCKREGETALRDVVQRLNVDYQTMAQCLLKNWGLEVCSTITAPNRKVYASLKAQYCR